MIRWKMFRCKVAIKLFVDDRRNCYGHLLFLFFFERSVLLNECTYYGEDGLDAMATAPV